MFMVILSSVVEKLARPSLRNPSEPTPLRFDFRGIPQQFHCRFGGNRLRQLFIQPLQMSLALTKETQ